MNQILVLRVNGDREFLAIHEGRGQRVKFVLKKKDSSSYQTREEWYLSSGASMKLSMFLAGIRNATRHHEFNDEPTPTDDPRVFDVEED